MPVQLAPEEIDAGMANPQPAAPAAPPDTATQKPAKPAGKPAGAPVVLITLTVFVMLLLSALAIIIYLTTQPA